MITGGTSGIGLETIKTLIKNEEYQIVSVTRSEKRVTEATELLGLEARKIDFLLGDVTQKEDCLNVYEYIKLHYGMFYGLVHGAGVMKNGGIEGESLDDWAFTMNTNLHSVFLLTKTLLPLLKKNKEGVIVNISSIASDRAGASLSYSVSKAGIDMMTKHLAKELGKYHIRVNAVSPGIVRSNFHFTSDIFQTLQEREAFLEEAKKLYPIGRIGEPSDIAPLIEFLLSEKASWITGSIMRIDGGRMV